MFDYKFEKLKGSGFFTFGFSVDYRKVIKKNSEKGWRFVQLVATKWDGHGKIQEADMIFERPKFWEENMEYIPKKM